MLLPLLLSLMFGMGVYLLYDGLTRPARRAQPDAPGRLHRVQELLVQAGLTGVTPGGFLLVALGCGLVAALLAQLLLGWTVISLLAGALGAATLPLYYLQRRGRRRAALQQALVEAIAQLRDAIRTGLGVQEGLAGLARSGPDVLRPEFARLVREMRLDGFVPALAAMRDRLADPLFDVVAATLLLNDRLGGRNVSQVLDRLAHATQAQLQLQEQLRAAQVRTVTSARIIAAVPPVLLLVIRLLNPGYMAVFNDATGQLILAGCAASVATGYGLMRWLTRMPAERRLFR